MAGGHKYIRRTGSPGSYRYWYKLPDGRVSEGNDAQQKQGRVEHAKRMLAGRDSGTHTLSNEHIARQTGHPEEKVRSLHSNMRTAAREGSGRRAHDFEQHHLEEAQHGDVNSREYASHVETHAASAPGGSTRPSRGAANPRPAGSRPSRGVSRGRGLEPEGGDSAPASRPVTPAPTNLGASVTPQVPGPGSRAMGPGAAPATPAASATPAATPAAPDPEARKRELLDKLKRDHGLDLGGTPAAPAAAASTPAASEGPTGSPEEAAAARQMSERLRSAAPAMSDEQQARLEHSQREAHAITTGRAQQAAAQRAPTNLGASVTPQVPGPGARGMDTPAAPRAPHPSTSSQTPHGQELVRFDPDFAASEAATTRMIEQQQAGANPYITRAADIFGKIMEDVAEPRKTKVRHMLDAVVKAHNESQEHGTTMSKDLVFAHFKAIPGNANARSLPASDFEAATFHTLDEVINNTPIDPEVERMKRGFAAKQMTRMRPFLSTAFRTAHPDAPPPYPTYNDLKRWSEHKEHTGEDRPDWAGGTGNMRQGQQRAMPKEFFDSIPKGADGKPAMPPGWLPLHLAPLWNYTVKSKGTGKAYAGSTMSTEAAAQRGVKQGREQKIAMAPQAPTDAQIADGTRLEESILMASLRKYVQMRGGPGQLVDIPKGKLPQGVQHADLFKADDGGELDDAALQKLAQHKIIDPVGLMSTLTKELGVKLKDPNAPKKPAKKKPVEVKVVKSFDLVLDDPDAAYEPRKTLLKSVPLERRVEVPSLVIDVKKARRLERVREELRARGSL